MSPAEMLAAQNIDAAGQAGGRDEVMRIAERGWPETRALDVGDLEESEVRAAIRAQAKAVLR